MSLTENQNVILITVDSLRWDRLGCYGYARPTTPYLDAFAHSCHFFRYAFSTGPNTPHSFPGIMASVSALSSRRLGLFDAPITLAEVLQDRGYTTIGINAANPYISRCFRYDRGFDDFHDYIDFSPTENNRKVSARPAGDITIPDLDLHHYVISEKSLHDKALLENAITEHVTACLYKHRNERVFIWLHFMDPHYPYVPRFEFQREMEFEPLTREDALSLNRSVRENLTLSPSQLDHVNALYDAAVRQVDAKVGGVISQLKKLKLFDDSLIVFTADHGEEFQEHGDLQHHSKLYDELIRVPLLLKLPGQRRQHLHEAPVSLLSLAPMIVSLSGENPFENDTLFANRERPTVFAEANYGSNGGTPVDKGMFHTDPIPKRACVRDHKWKLIFDSRGEFRLFDLLTDPDETEDRFHTAEVADLRHCLLARYEKLERQRLRRQVNDVRRKVTHKIGTHHGLCPPS